MAEALEGVDAAVLGVLLAQSSLTALVGERIRLDAAEQGDARPLIVIESTGFGNFDCVDGSTSEWKSVAFSMHCLADTSGGAVRLRERLFSLLHMQDFTQSGFELCFTHQDGETNPQFDKDSDGRPIYQQSADYTVLFRRTS